MLERFVSQIEKNHLLEPNQTYLVAVSGGLDSVVLHDILTRLAPDWGWHLIVAHVDHSQRSDSAEDALFVSQLADQAQQPFLLHRLEPVTKTEEDLRHSRQAWLEAMRKAQSAQSVVTAHHRDDRLETAIWHAIRGSDRTGLTSLKPRNKTVVRPLLGLSRAEILHYATQRQLDWHEDSTNVDRSYTRNLIRHELLHQAPRRDHNFHNNFTEWLDHLGTLNTGIDVKLDHLSQRLSAATDLGRSFKRQAFLRFSNTIQAALLAHWVRQLTAGRGLTSKNLGTALNWLSTATTGSFTEALPGLILIREYDTVSLVPRSAPIPNETTHDTVPLGQDQPLRFGNLKLTLTASTEAPEQQFSLLPGVYYVRRWQPGDRISPIGMTGTKKVQDVFVDKKISRSQRLIWPLIVTASNDVALIPNLVRDRRYTTPFDPTALQLQVETI